MDIFVEVNLRYCSNGTHKFAEYNINNLSKSFTKKP